MRAIPYYAVKSSPAAAISTKIFFGCEISSSHCGRYEDNSLLSTDKALFSFTDEILSALNNKMHVAGISCAFECVNLELLLSKLNFYGIRDIAGQ
jgi:hypothetical protein